MAILAVGSVALDTIKAPGGTVEEAIGGSATYFALAASLYAPVAVVAVVGDDFPAAAVEMLVARGVDCAGLERRPGKTFRWCGRYEDDVNVAITESTDLGVFADFRPMIPARFRRHPFVFLGNIEPALQAAVLEQVTEPKLVVMDTMNFWIENRRDDLEAVIRRVDVLVVNDAEARLLAGTVNLVRAMKKLLTLGPRYVLAKKGEHGAILMARDFQFAVPAIPLADVVDPTGAGDTFAGGFVGFLAATGKVTPANLCRAVAHGVAVSSFAVEGLSVNRLASIKRADVEERLQLLGELTKF